MNLRSELARIVGSERVLARPIDRLAFANDASVYRLVPAAVVLPKDVEEIRALFRLSQASGVPLTFRAAGTSLSGQAVTDGILAVVSRHWRALSVEQGGRRVRVQPGVIGGDVNRRLRPLGVKIGPDPASINACMMGGILANNSSGMCCGVAQNAYHTLAALRFVLPDGTLVDSARPDADEKLARDAPGLHRGLLELRGRIVDDPALRERIRDKYRMKNTTGYSLNAFLDHAEPVQILTHLMIGSEGTLGFIAEALLETVPDYPLKYTGLLFFEDVPRACAAIAPIRESGARALELMDRASLRAVQDQPGMPDGIRDLPPRAAALLVEYQCATAEQLAAEREACGRVLPGLPLVDAPSFTDDETRQAALWRVRKGLIPSVGAMRRRGTSFIIEDVVFPLERLADGVRELQRLFVDHGYHDGIVFGHAKDGNLHFVLTQAFQDPADVRRYDGFMHALADLVAVRYDGALKAEHGTGRNMAPFVLDEWGAAGYAVMRELKRLIDPRGLLNPGVILNDDPAAHVTHLKSLPQVEPEVDACIECGFCERMCPSRDLTLTPRQRIVVRREMARLRGLDPASSLLRELEADYVYAALETCATDGLCALACPVGIDTGKLTKRLRRERRPELAEELAALLARRFDWIERGARLSLVGGRWLDRLLGDGGAPRGGWRARARELPPPPRSARPRTRRAGADAVYFPCCISRVVGPAGDGGAPPLPQTLIEVAGRAGARPWLPEDAGGHCCGLPFSSKGYRRAFGVAAGRTLEALDRWSDGGRLPVVVDSSPCAQTLREAAVELAPAPRSGGEPLRILDGIEYAHDVLLPRLVPRRAPGTVALHPVCSVRKMNLVGRLEALARACAENVEIPFDAGCCGFAGDRGFSHPELTAAALRGEAAEIAAGRFCGLFSSSRTCEIGLARATGKPWGSFWELLEVATR